MKNFKEWSEKEIKQFNRYQEKAKREYQKNTKIDSVLLVSVGIYARDVIKKVSNSKNISKFHIENPKYKKEISEHIKENDYIIICTDSSDSELTALAEKVADICFKLDKRFMICHSCAVCGIWNTQNADDFFTKNRNKFVKNIRDKQYIINEIPFIQSGIIYDKFEYKFKEDYFTSYISTAFFDREISSNTFAELLSINLKDILEK